MNCVEASALISGATSGRRIPKSMSSLKVYTSESLRFGRFGCSSASGTGGRAGIYLRDELRERAGGEGGIGTRGSTHQDGGHMAAERREWR